MRKLDFRVREYPSTLTGHYSTNIYLVDVSDQNGVGNRRFFKIFEDLQIIFPSTNIGVVDKMVITKVM